MDLSDSRLLGLGFSLAGVRLAEGLRSLALSLFLLPKKENLVRVFGLG